MIDDLFVSIPMLLAFLIPIIAIVGGITVGIVKTVGRQRLEELARRERIAAIERGIDVNQLPPLPTGSEEEAWSEGDGSSMRVHRTRQGLLIGGLLTTAVGLGLMLMLYFLSGDRSWAVGFIPLFIGVALLLSFFLIRPIGGGGGSRPPTG